MGQPELGIKEMEDAHRLAPGNLEVADALAQYYNDLGVGARAQQICLEALALAPDNPALQNNRCFAYYQAGKWSQADPLIADPLPSQASSPAVNHESETAARPAAPPPAVAAAELAATRAPKQIAPDSGSRVIPAAKTVSDQVSQVASLTHQPAPGLVADNRPARPWPPRSEMVAAPSLPSPPREAPSPARPDKPTPQPVLASQPDPALATGKTSLENPRANPRAPIMVRELMETNIAVLNGKGMHNLAYSTRSRLHLEGSSVVAIYNFSKFGVDRTVIYYRLDAERVATTLNKKFFPGAELESAPRLAGSIDVKVVLGHDLGRQQQAEAPQAHGLRL